jgi:broad specificity phosphatase PhoE
MKKLLLILAVFCFSFNIQAQNNNTTTYYFIRHAEKIRIDKTNKNPNLTAKGLERAKNWSEVFKNVKFDFIYSTKYNRTMQTAKPTAESNHLEIQNYSPSYLNDDNFKSKTNGKTVLIVGHSNTTPQFVNDILGILKYPEIKDNNNSNLYIVTISNKNKQSILLKIPF